MTPSPRRVAWFWVLALLPALACGFGPAAPDLAAPDPAAPVPAAPVPVTPRPTATAMVPPFAGTALAPVAALPAPPPTFAPLDVADAALAPPLDRVSPDVESLVNPELLGRLTPAQQLVLSRQGFVAAPGDAPHLYTIYQEAAQAGAPIYVTLDAVIEAAHALLAEARQAADVGLLDPALAEQTVQMVGYSLAQLEATAAGPVQAAAFANLAFFSTAAALLDPAFPVPGAVASPVADELTLLQARAGSFISPVTGELVDYAAYAAVATGDRTEGPAAARLWYATHPFNLDGELERGRGHARQLLLMGRALHLAGLEGAAARQEAARYFFYGRHPDDLSLRDAALAAATVYGGWPDPAALQDLTLLDSFTATLREAAGGASVRWWPRPWTPADSVLPTLLFNRVGGYAGPEGRAPFSAVETPIGLVRGVPHGLDMAAAFGSARAGALLTAAGEDDYQGFAAQLAEARATVETWRAEPQERSLAESWLLVLEPLLAPSGPEQPFPGAPGWSDRRLTTWTAAWALQQRQAEIVAAPVDANELPATATGAPGGFVEPEPRALTSLAALLAQARLGLEAGKILDAALEARLQRLEKLLLDLARVAERQGAGDKEQGGDEAARGAGDDGALLAGVGAALGEIMAPGDDLEVAPVAAVVTVFANDNTGQALQLGLGDGWALYAIVPIDGQPTLAVGAVFGLYASRAPIGDGWSDADWRGAGQRPAPAPWLNSYTAP